MNVIGKIIGGFFGFLMLGPIGAIIGIIIGHYLDNSFRLHGLRSAAHSSEQRIFFDTTFAIMGYVAKADGRVSENEIQSARLIMQQLGMHGQRKQDAIRQFNKGKQTDFNPEQALDALHKNYTYSHLLRLFIELQIQIAYADGPPTAKVKGFLQHINQRLNLGRIDFSHIDAMRYGRTGEQNYQRQQRYHQQPPFNVNDAYKILDIEANANITDIKKAYRRKINENHPDKMIAKGLPKEMIKLATEKTQQIKSAYEQIRKERNF